MGGWVGGWGWGWGWGWASVYYPRWLSVSAGTVMTNVETSGAGLGEHGELTGRRGGEADSPGVIFLLWPVSSIM